VLLLSFAMEVVPDKKVALAWLPDRPLPHVCVSRRVLGVTCPGCGLTRSFIHLAHGRWSQSLAVHRLGWLIALIVAAQLPYRLVALARRGHTGLSYRVVDVTCLILVGLLLLNWGLGLVI